MATVTGGDKAKRALAELAPSASPRSVRVGFLEGATYPDGTPVPLVAALNEYGVPARGQPPRPFMRHAIAEHSGEWPERLAGLLANGTPTDKALAILGETIAGDLRASINSLTSPPLAPATVAAKGFDKPLIDTSQMLNSVDYEVE